MGGGQWGEDVAERMSEDVTEWGRRKSEWEMNLRYQNLFPVHSSHLLLVLKLPPLKIESRTERTTLILGPHTN